MGAGTKWQVGAPLQASWDASVDLKGPCIRVESTGVTRRQQRAQVERGPSDLASVTSSQSIAGGWTARVPRQGDVIRGRICGCDGC